jgi:hypothetical protein
MIWVISVGRNNKKVKGNTKRNTKDGFPPARE